MVYVYFVFFYVFVIVYVYPIWIEAKAFKNLHYLFNIHSLVLTRS